MTIQQQQFLELLRSGLWGTPADTRLFSGKTDWKTILKTAMEQAVPVIIADGINTLPENLWPPKEAILKLAMIRTKTAQTHLILSRATNQVSTTFEADGIPSALLKGQGLAQNYPAPQSRSCGDIDLYVSAENFLKAYDILAGIDGVQMPDTSECESHILAHLGGAIVELHWKADVLTGRKTDSSWQKWTRESIDSHFSTNDLPTWNNDGRDIPLPEPTFNAIFILHHALRHMISEGIGFRHVCDWAMFLHRNHDRLNLHLLEKKLKEYRMWAVWKEFAILTHKVIGLPKESIPFFPAKASSRHTDKLAEKIFESGNFGHHSIHKRSSDEPDYIKRKWHNFRFQMLRLISLFPVFPSVTLSYGWNWFLDATLRFVTRRVR